MAGAIHSLIDYKMVLLSQMLARSMPSVITYYTYSHQETRH